MGEANDGFENCCVYILRHTDSDRWIANAETDDAVKLCLWAALEYMRSLGAEFSACACCDTVFSQAYIPESFVVLIPVEEDLQTVKADVRGVCLECSKHDDDWLIDQGVHREGLAPTPARLGDSIN